MNNQSNAKLSGWRSLLWVPDDDPAHNPTAEELHIFGNGKKASLLCCLNCRSELWGHPVQCPFCMQPLPQRG